MSTFFDPEPRRCDNTPRTHYYGDDCSPPHGFPGFCRHCGDGTDIDDDPAPDCCLMCAKAGRASRLVRLDTDS